MKRFREESSYAASSYAAPTPLPALVRDEIIWKFVFDKNNVDELLDLNDVYHKFITQIK